MLYNLTLNFRFIWILKLKLSVYFIIIHLFVPRIVYSDDLFPTQTSLTSEKIGQETPSEKPSVEDQPVVEERQQAEPKKPLNQTIVEIAQETTSEEPSLREKPPEQERITADIFGKKIVLCTLSSRLPDIIRTMFSTPVKRNRAIL